MNKEKWLPVVGYEGRYFVSNIGRVKNAYGKILRSDTRLKTGYKYVVLRNGTSGFHANIHRLVAAGLSKAATTAGIGSNLSGMRTGTP